MALEVGRQIVDPLREERDLPRRRSCVFGVRPVLGDRRRLFKTHDVYSPRIPRRVYAKSFGAQQYTGSGEPCKGVLSARTLSRPDVGKVPDREPARVGGVRMGLQGIRS